MWVPCWRSFPGNEAHKLFSQDWGFRVGAKKFMLKKFLVLFSPQVILNLSIEVMDINACQAGCPWPSPKLLILDVRPHNLWMSTGRSGAASSIWPLFPRAHTHIKCLLLGPSLHRPRSPNRSLVSSFFNALLSSVHEKSL